MLLEGLGEYGDISVFKIIANGKDISESITQIVINQSIFNGFWYASLLVNDTTNLKNNVPLIDGCDFTITVGTKVGSKWDGTKEYRMVMQSIDNSDQVNHMHSNYVINLIDEIVIEDNGINITKVFENERHSSAVSKIGSEYLGKLIETDNSDSGITVVIPSLKPMEAINLIAKSATNNGNADYVFFQKDYNIWGFHSLSKLYAQPSSSFGINFTRIPTNMTKHKDINFDYSTNMLQIQLTYPDAMQDSLGGYYGSRIHVYNMKDKTYNQIMFDGESSSNFDKNNKFNKDLSSSKNSVVKTIYKQDSASENGITMAENFEKWVGERRLFMNIVSRNVLLTQTFGVAMCWKFLGKTCEVKLPSQQDMTDDIDDELYTGKFLISKVTQKINRTSYIINYELIKLKVNKTDKT